ncbi:phosphatidylserine/phosphatidylglycerophosphate/cardiolipin synthase family protein [Methylophilus sp.]|uniref:phospholipase D-like domain-containing protein n=1 Tax=Methylophilus sp. TaxID=29541 RepID=UPI0025F657FA|nr:phospholipase D-like domain-containing protein [Methylophilus sp.]
MTSLWLSGCATIPDAKQALSEIKTQTQPVTVVTAKQTLPPGKVDQALKKLTSDESIRTSLAEHLRVEQALSGNSLYADNKVTMLFNGELTFSHMRQALEKAQQHIHLEYFTFEDVDLGGITLQALLLEKLAQGVSVHLIYDAIGSADTPPALFDHLKAAGAKITVFHPVQASSLASINQRDHRKIMVVDGKLAIVGGVNLSKTYQSKGSLRFFSKQKLPDLQQANWRDTDIMITGPVVANIQQAFLAHWDAAQPLDTRGFFPTLTKQGGQFVRVITTPASKRKNTDSPYYLALIAAIQNAQHHIILNSAYFVPTSAQEEALVNAADRGVQVSLLVPSFSDSTLSMHVQRSHYSHLLKHGIAIYEMQDQVLHAKMVSIDGVWSVIGSSNFDYRSAGINAEIDVVILGNDTASLLESRFEQDVKNAEKIEWQQWQERPLWQKIKQQSSRMFEGML